MNRGLFITFEGGEGAGKSTQVELLTKRLMEEGYPVVATREPGGTRIGEQIRAITHNPENVDLHAIAEAYLMAAARAQHVAERIEPALESGKIVVCDRYVDSNIVYQGYGRKLGGDDIRALNRLAINGAIPDITILLDVPLSMGLDRRNSSTKKDRLDLQHEDFYTRVYEGYKELAQNEPQRFVLVDARRSIEVVASDIWNIVKPKLDARVAD